jgi:hypothetical protein
MRIINNLSCNDKMSDLIRIIDPNILEKRNDILSHVSMLEFQKYSIKRIYNKDFLY